MKRLLEFIGFEPGRFQARWISGSEGQKWADNATQISQVVEGLGPNSKLRD